MSLPTILSSKPIHANPFFAEGSFMTDVEQFLHFFEVDAQFITEVVDKEAEVTKVHVENVNAFIVVAAFIAGVQGTITGLTFGRNDTILQAWTNGIGFVGLTFDILGTSFGLLLALSLQTSIRRSKGSSYNKTLVDGRDEVRRLISGPTTDESCQRVVDVLGNELKHRRRFWRRRLQSHIVPADKSFIEHRNRLFGDSSENTNFSWGPSIILSHISGPQQRWSMAYIPILNMGIGIACLLVSVVCFAAYTQPRPVWMACVIVAAITVAFSASCLAYLVVPSVAEEYISRFRAKPDPDRAVINLQKLKTRLNSPKS